MPGFNNTGNITFYPRNVGFAPLNIVFKVRAVNDSCATDYIRIPFVVLPVPDPTIVGCKYSCDGVDNPLRVNKFPGDKVLWSTGDTTDQIMTRTFATFSVTVTRGICSAISFFKVEPINFGLYIVPDTNNPFQSFGTICKGDTIILGVTGNDIFDLRWNNNINPDTSRFIVITEAGSTNVIASFCNCSIATSRYFREKEPPVVLSYVFPPSCDKGNDGKISLDIQSYEYFTLEWEDGSTSPVRENLIPGLYNYTIQYGKNCFVSGTANVTGSPRLNLFTTVTNPLCQDINSGSIIINNVQNATSPYFFSLNGSSFTQNNSFTRLPPGQYEIVINDAKGCSSSTLFTLNEPKDIDVSLPDTVIKPLGVPITLAPVITNPEPSDKYSWFPATGLSCSECLETVVESDVSREYLFTAENSDRCTDSAMVFVKVLELPKIWLPEAFTPNNDGVNDRLFPMSDDSQLKIVRFQVFNRWGNTVFLRSDFLINDQQNGWDGQFNNTSAPMDNYLVVIEAVDKLGRQVYYKGSVLLLK
jgi:gliding motility-associated-like protein